MTVHEKSRVDFHLRQAAVLRNLCLQLSKAGKLETETTAPKIPETGRVAEWSTPTEAVYKAK